MLCNKPVGDHCTIVGHVKGDQAKPIVMVPARLVQAWCYVSYATESAACLSDVPENAVLGAQANDGEYPGAYHKVMHLFAPASPSGIDRMILLVRTFNALISVAFFGALAWLVPIAMRRQMVYVLVANSVPLLIYVLTSVNPSAWGITGVVSVWFALTGLFATAHDAVYPRWKRRALACLAVLAAAIAAAARADCATYCVVAVLAVGAFHLPELKPRHWRQHRLTWLAMIVVTIIGAYGSLSASQVDMAVGVGRQTGSPALLVYNAERLPELLMGYWTNYIGAFDVPLLPITTVLTTAVALGLLFFGLHCLSWQKALAAGGVLFVLVASPLLSMQMRGNEIGEFVQPRYLAPVALMLVAVVISRCQGHGAPVMTLPQTAMAYSCLVVAHAFSLQSLIKRYALGWDAFSQNLNHHVLWWRPWLPAPMTVWFLGSLGFAAMALLLFVVRSKYFTEKELLRAT